MIVIESLTWLLIFYFMSLNFSYLLLNLIGGFSLNRYMRRIKLVSLPSDYGRFEPPVSVLVPAYNEALTIVASLQSVLQLEYHQYENIVINDGSKDQTLQVLIDHFDLKPYPIPGHENLQTQPIHSLYRTPKDTRLLVIDKANGGKADSLNAGINFATYPLVCSLDADSILQRNSLSQAAQPFLDHSHMVCTG